MPIPEFQEFMLPLLTMADDKQEHTLSESIDRMAQQFALSDEDQKELLPSGTQSRLYNRVVWAEIYLKKAILLEGTGRGKFRITTRGLDLLRTSPSSIDTPFLMRYPEFQEFRRPQKAHVAELAIEEETGQTPEEILEASYQSFRQRLAQDILARVKECSPAFFEKLVVDLLVAMGYGGSRKDAGQAIGRSGDGGIDGIIKEDKLGLDIVYIQAKRWENVVGRPLVQAFAGSLDGYRARKGVMITTSYYSQDAIDYVNRIEKKIVLIDGEQLAQFMIDHDVSVTEVARYVVKRVDLDYFDEE
jgi:restriction system protein